MKNETTSVWKLRGKEGLMEALSGSDGIIPCFWTVILVFQMLLYVLAKQDILRWENCGMEVTGKSSTR